MKNKEIIEIGKLWINPKRTTDYVVIGWGAIVFLFVILAMSIRVVDFMPFFNISSYLVSTLFMGSIFVGLFLFFVRECMLGKKPLKCENCGHEIEFHKGKWWHVEKSKGEILYVKKRGDCPSPELEGEKCNR